MAASKKISAVRVNIIVALSIATLWFDTGCIPEAATSTFSPAPAIQSRLAGVWQGRTHCEGRTNINGFTSPFSYDGSSDFKIEIDAAGKPLEVPMSLGIGSAGEAAKVFGVGSQQSFSGASEVNGMHYTYEGSIIVKKAEFNDASFSVTYDIRLTQRGPGQTITGIGTQSVEVELGDEMTLEYVNRLDVDWTMTFDSAPLGSGSSTYHQELECRTNLIRG